MGSHRRRPGRSYEKLLGSTSTAVQTSATVCKANKKKNSFYISIHLHRVELENLVSHQVISQLNRILNYGKSSAKQSKSVDLNVSPRIFSLNLDQIPAQGRLPSWVVVKFHSTGDAFGSETFRGNPKSEQVGSRIFFHDFKSTKLPASKLIDVAINWTLFPTAKGFFHVHILVLPWNCNDKLGRLYGNCWQWNSGSWSRTCRHASFLRW